MASHRSGFFAAVLLLVLGVLAVSTFQTASGRDGLLHVWVLDVGQGDAIFIQTPQGNQVLVDGGPDGAVLSRLAEVMGPHDRTIDAVVVSHPHSDHIAGLVSVLGRYDVSLIVEAHEAYDSGQFRTWRHAADQESARHVEAVAGMALELGGGIRLVLLHPFHSVAGTTTSTPHDDSVVAMLEYGSFSMILTGDMEAPLERALAERGIGVDADVLKVGHHGSSTSSSQAFLDQVTPQVAVMSLGAKNRYRHPAPAVVARLEKNRIKQYRTDINGSVEIASDGTTFAVRSAKP